MKVRVLAALTGSVLALGLPSGPALGQSLERAASTFATRWGAGEASIMEGSFAGDGVRLQMEARELGSLDARRAVASIREYLGSREGVETRVVRVEEVGGDPLKGYAEIRWESRMRGTSDVLARTVFVAFVSEAGGWRVDELRVLP